MKENRIAIISPVDDAYSETFIQAHKNLLKGKVYFYYGTLAKQKLSGFGILENTWKKPFYKIQRNFFQKNYSWYYQQILLDSFKQNKIDVVLAEYGNTIGPYLPVLRKLNLPLIVHFHGYDASILEVIEINKSYKDIFEYASFIIVVSRKMEEDILRLGCPRAKLIYNVYGPNDLFFNNQPDFLNLQFFAAGRFVDKKAPHYTILAFQKVIKEFPKAKLIMAGDGPLIYSCKNLVRFLGLEKNVLFVGVLDQKKMSKYLEKSLAFVQHSVRTEYGDMEGTPLTILEASAAALPVISTRHGGIVDIIKENKSGFLVNEHDVEGMAKSMRKLLCNNKLAKEMGEKGRGIIKNSFTLSRHISVLNDLLYEVKKQDKSIK
ncbi:glycosyltransferase [Salegentibacter sp. F188]|uniref:Glycosyltransferase n=1 Tax=Autumnicola patrickiae TaxID=3075591 RepID=A0ABU3DY19_9FLAO|nr:glycosyltransferase [Salegentibacter sp. F188]MDT0688605.1 glycosyltransferase [Salegentibacter sp. F188]